MFVSFSTPGNGKGTSEIATGITEIEIEREIATGRRGTERGYELTGKREIEKGIETEND